MKRLIADMYDIIPYDGSSYPAGFLVHNIEDTFIVKDLPIEDSQIEDSQIEDSQIKNENNFIYNTKNDVETNTHKKRRGRPSKKSQQ